MSALQQAQQTYLDHLAVERGLAEALEDEWRDAPQAERDFLQGLVHVTVAWHHAANGNQPGASRQLEKAVRRLGPYAPTHRDVDVTRVLGQVEAAAARVRQARSEIRVTYTRRFPPTQYTTRAAAEYFKAIVDWAAEDTDDERCVRRIIGIPERDGVPDDAMCSWARQHHEDTKSLLTYEASVLRWPAAADGLNMALIDDDVVFLAFSGGPRQKLNGFSVENPTFLSYFAGYFEQLWAVLQPLEDYLRDVDDGRVGPPGKVGN